jgi:hypothetical protein
LTFYCDFFASDHPHNPDSSLKTQLADSKDGSGDDVEKKRLFLQINLLTIQDGLVIL